MRRTNGLIGLIVLTLFLMVGCHSKSMDRLLGTNTDDSQKAPEFLIVSCCRDNDGNGNMTYPAFLPESHVELCQRIRTDKDGQFNGNSYLASSVDCEQESKVGSQYYKGHGY